MENLPQHVLDGIVDCTLRLEPSLRLVFLSSLGTRIHASACRFIFNTVSIQDDARQFSTKCVISTIISSPKRYAQYVKNMVIRESDSLYSPSTDPLEADTISFILKTCGNVEELSWQSSLPPPDGLCEMLSSYNPRLTRFTYNPNRSRTVCGTRLAVKWDAPSLPLLLSVTSLHLSHLSQAGARAFSSLLSRIGEYSLEDLSIDFVWLDDTLCERIVQAGRRLRRVQIGTSGTKLSDKGVTAIIEGCDALEELVLDSVQGRLSRTLWTKPERFPPSLASFGITFSEDYGPHHSWTADHMASLGALPFSRLTSLSIVRREALPRLTNGAPVYISPVDDVLALRPVPADFITGLKNAKSLLRFECDWWPLGTADVKNIIESCPNLEVLKFCLNEPFAKLIGLASNFASLSKLRTLSVSVNPAHAPGIAPLPLIPFTKSSLPTPTDSPVLKSKSLLPQLLDFDQIHNSCSVVIGHDQVQQGDPSMPLMRDIKRFVRKCPELKVLEWYGKFGRGSWIVSRSAAQSKLSSVGVKYQPPAITNDTWKIMLQERDAEQANPNFSRAERTGQSWTGFTAEVYAEERRLAAEKEKEDRLKEKKTRVISTNGSPPAGDVSPTMSTISISSPTKSPSRRKSVALMTPPPSASSSISNMLDSKDDCTFFSSESLSTFPALTRRRAPSEPTKPGQASSHTRSRSAVSGLVSAADTAKSSKRGKGRGTPQSAPKIMLDYTATTSSRGRGRGAGKSYGGKKVVAA